MALDRQGQLVTRHADAVIFHQQQVGAAIGSGDVDAGGAGIDGIFHQFLDRGGGPFDHFTGGDAVDRTFGETANLHRRNPTLPLREGRIAKQFREGTGGGA